MTTAIADPTAPAGTDAPVDLASAFYGSPSETPVDLPAESQPTSTPTAEPGTATPPQEPVAPAAEVKPDAPKEAETEKAKDDDSHRQAARRLGKQVQELESKLDLLAEENKVLKARLDGTYEEPQQPTPEEIAKHAAFVGREMASREVANQRYGEEAVTERLFGDRSAYAEFSKAHPRIHQHIIESQQPILEAWRYLDLHEFEGKYGKDPSQWKAKIIEEAKPDITEEIKKTLKAPVIGTPAPSVTQARGSGGPTKREPSLADVFYKSPTPTA